MNPEVRDNLKLVLICTSGEVVVFEVFFSDLWLGLGRSEGRIFIVLALDAVSLIQKTTDLIMRLPSSPAPVRSQALITVSGCGTEAFQVNVR